MTTKEMGFGVNVWWTIPGTIIDGIKAQTLLQKHGFEVGDMKLPSRLEEVSRAVYSFQDRRSKDNRRIVEKVKETPDEVVYGILDRAQDGDEVGFSQKTTVRMDKNTGSVTVEGSLKDDVLKILPMYKGKITEDDVRDFLRKVIKLCFGIAKRPSGGIYFVPGKFAGIVESAQAFLSEVNVASRIYVERIMDGAHERQNVWESLEADVEDRLASAVAAVGRIERRASAVQGQRDNITEAEELMKVYQHLLGEEAKYEDLAEKIEAAVKVVSDKMAEIQPGVPTGPKGTPKTAKGTTSTKAGGTVVDAAIKVLSTAGTAMTAKEIMDEAVKLGLYTSNCAAPYESFVSGLTKAMARGDNRVRRVARGVYQIAA